jgi:hypothetical protein
LPPKELEGLKKCDTRSGCCANFAEENPGHHEGSCWLEFEQWFAILVLSFETHLVGQLCQYSCHDQCEWVELESHKVWESRHGDFLARVVLEVASLRVVPMDLPEDLLVERGSEVVEPMDKLVSWQ